LGCIACRLEGRTGVLPDIHHITDRGRRMGHQHTIPLCPWHHRAVPLSGLTTPESERVIGPSLARSKRQFTERYATELQLLALTDEALRAAA
jgi:hypothetical protein